MKKKLSKILKSKSKGEIIDTFLLKYKISYDEWIKFNNHIRKAYVSDLIKSFFSSKHWVLLWIIPLLISFAIFCTFIKIGLFLDSDSTIKFPKIFLEAQNMYQIFINTVFGIILVSSTIFMMFFSFMRISNKYSDD